MKLTLFIPPSQRIGQALVESIVLMLVFISFFVAIPWLGRLIDIGIQQSNASRYAAFQWARQLTSPDKQQLKQQFFLSHQHNWRDRQQNKIVNASDISIQSERKQVLSDDMQPGKRVGQADVLRRQWGLQDQGIVTVKLDITPHYTNHHISGKGALDIDAGFLERIPLTIYRHTAILINAGHSDSDIASHRRVGQSALAWKTVTEQSYVLGKHIQRYAAPVEGFSRHKPVFDWLVPWAGKLPKHHLRGK